MCGEFLGTPGNARAGSGALSQILGLGTHLRCGLKDRPAHCMVASHGLLTKVIVVVVETESSMG